MSTWREQPALIPEEQIQHRHEADVVVVGLAHAGSAAARAAAEAGCRVIGIEEKKEKTYSVWGADCGHINSKFLESRGVPKVDPIDYYNEIQRRAMGRANPALMMRFAQKSGENFDWYTDMVEDWSGVSVAFWPGAQKFDGEMAGFRFWPGTAKFGMPGGRNPFGGGPGGKKGPGGPGGKPDIPGGIPDKEEMLPPQPGQGMSAKELVEDVKIHPSLLGLCRANQQKAIDLGGEMYFGMSAENIIKEDGRVTGILAKDAATGEYHLFRAKKSVILAAGGFAGNKEMLEDLLPDFKGLFCDGEDWPRSMGRKGMAIKLGVWAGGKLENGPIATMGGNFNLPRGFNCTMGQLWLDPSGKRFCNELFGGPEISGMQGQQMKHGTYFNIFDSNIVEDLQWSVPSHESFDFGEGMYTGNITRAMEGAQAAGKGGVVERAPNGPVRIVCGRNMEELLDNAELTGEIRENVRASIERYNEICRSGRDDDFGKDAKLLRPLDQWPLYIQFNDFNYVGRIMCTCGGLLTDGNQNVLDNNYDPIPGLFATGNCCGRRFGPQYSTPTAGLSIGVCITLGREAGIEAAK
ncbi:MAG: FAD-binding protein [Oscillospiraceae bacterium]|nr:FAD-binding protein [Oscillospiraceae bacterium]